MNYLKNFLVANLTFKQAHRLIKWFKKTVVTGTAGSGVDLGYSRGGAYFQKSFKQLIDFFYVN